MPPLLMPFFPLEIVIVYGILIEFQHCIERNVRSDYR